jgi:hypothetical protein
MAFYVWYTWPSVKVLFAFSHMTLTVGGGGGGGIIGEVWSWEGGCG